MKKMEVIYNLHIKNTITVKKIVKIIVEIIEMVENIGIIIMEGKLDKFIMTIIIIIKEVDSSNISRQEIIDRFQGIIKRSQVE
jgi:hypothetical protein